MSAARADLPAWCNRLKEDLNIAVVVDDDGDNLTARADQALKLSLDGDVLRMARGVERGKLFLPLEIERIRAVRSEKLRRDEIVGETGVRYQPADFAEKLLRRLVGIPALD